MTVTCGCKDGFGKYREGTVVRAKGSGSEPKRDARTTRSGMSCGGSLGPTASFATRQDGPSRTIVSSGGQSVSAGDGNW